MSSSTSTTAVDVGRLYRLCRLLRHVATDNVLIALYKIGYGIPLFSDDIDYFSFNYEDGYCEFRTPHGTIKVYSSGAVHYTAKTVELARDAKTLSRNPDGVFEKVVRTARNIMLATLETARDPAFQNTMLQALEDLERGYERATGNVTIPYTDEDHELALALVKLYEVAHEATSQFTSLQFDCPLNSCTAVVWFRPREGVTMKVDKVKNELYFITNNAVISLSNRHVHPIIHLNSLDLDSIRTITRLLKYSPEIANSALKVVSEATAEIASRIKHVRVRTREELANAWKLLEKRAKREIASMKRRGRIPEAQYMVIRLHVPGDTGYTVEFETKDDKVTIDAYVSYDGIAKAGCTLHANLDPKSEVSTSISVRTNFYYVPDGFPEEAMSILASIAHAFEKPVTWVLEVNRKLREISEHYTTLISEEP